MSKGVRIGYDAGSEFVHSAALDDLGRIIFSPKSVMHFGNPAKAIKNINEIYQGNGINPEYSRVVFTGSGGELISRSLGTSYYQDSVTIPRGANLIEPNARYVFHVGSRDPYFFELSTLNSSGKSNLFVPDFSTGTKCGGGSGLLIGKQSRRFFDNEVLASENLQTRLEKTYILAFNSAKESDEKLNVGGRCGVVIQSDMIHLQNSGKKVKNIFRGMLERVIENYVSDVIRIRKLDKNQIGIVSGGVFSNPFMIELLKQKLCLDIRGYPQSSALGAIGAALLANDQDKSPNFEGLNEIINLERKNLAYAPPLSSALNLISSEVETPLKSLGDVKIYLEIAKKEDCVFGLDGGSTTTKAVLSRAKTLEVIADICVETHGKPVEAAQRVFSQINNVFGDTINIRAIAYTGSSGGLYYKLFTKPLGSKISRLDLVKDEITCHALGIKKYNPLVDTIFELGGQDAKYTRFDKDNVRKAKMNLSCMAGTGQTMQNMIKMLGLENFENFENLALSAQRTPIVDDSCGVFTEAAISKLISLGLPKEEIAAAIAYGFIGGYVNKFVGNEHLGEYISAQGGPFKSKACLAALALHTGKKIHAFPHRQLFGAYGAAIAADLALRENEN